MGTKYDVRVLTGPSRTRLGPVLDHHEHEKFCSFLTLKPQPCDSKGGALKDLSAQAARLRCFPGSGSGPRRRVCCGGPRAKLKCLGGTAESRRGWSPGLARFRAASAKKADELKQLPVTGVKHRRKTSENSSSEFRDWKIRRSPSLRKNCTMCLMMSHLV